MRGLRNKVARHWLVATSLVSTAVVVHTAPVEWPSYNRTVTSERFVPLKEISVRTVQDLHILCSYDTKETTAFQTGLLQVNGALYWTTEHDTFSVDPNTCQEEWRAHEEFPSAFLPVSRGAAFLDGRLFRGTNAGQVVAYDATSGKRLWSTTIADPKRGELVSASPIAWNGLVFIGNSGGDMKGVKGRMYALDAVTGRVRWEFFLVPKQPGDPSFGPAPPGSGAAPLSSWENDPQFPISGGGTWTSYSLDPRSGLIYVPGGNPSPDFVKDFRKGPNLYTGSVVVLDARTGEYRRHFQLVQPPGPGRIAERRRAIGEQDHGQGRRQRESRPGREGTGVTGAQKADRNAHLARGRTGQKLAERDEIGIAAVVEPAPPRDEFLAKIAEMGDRTAKGGQTQAQEDRQHLQPGSVARGSVRGNDFLRNRHRPYLVPPMLGTKSKARWFFRQSVHGIFQDSAVNPVCQETVMAAPATGRDPRHHTRKMQKRLQEIKDHLRSDIEKVDEPQLKAMFETSAEVLGGLIKAFHDYEQKNESAWRR